MKIKVRKHPIIYIILNFCLCMSCSPNNEANDIFTKSISKLILVEKLNTYKACIVIPGTGCSGCISSAEEFIASNYKNTKILFILTNMQSEKIFKAKTGIDIKNNANIIIDYKNKFSTGNVNSIYPTVYLLDKMGKLKSKHMVSPQEDGLVKLRQHIR